MKKIYLTLMVLLVLTSGLFVGCQKSKLKGLVPAEGVVTHNGTPVEGALVTFGPKTATGEAAGATGITDAQGKFKMMTLDPGDGVYPGEYFITVSKNIIEGGLSREDDWARMNDKSGEREKAETPEQTVTHMLPRQYEEIGMSGLEIVIPPEGKKDITLALEGEIDDTPQQISGPKR
ncbi:MAG: carboxypeptidase-like regulatory domain-containing protein [Planctomycetia bacterium]|nr:carboxypeptidase-like regulatory domain-containing protein [Planctomycetia bacterium]